jgi:hypothetical protein
MPTLHQQEQHEKQPTVAQESVIESQKDSNHV